VIGKGTFTSKEHIAVVASAFFLTVTGSIVALLHTASFYCLKEETITVTKVPITAVVVGFTALAKGRMSPVDGIGTKVFQADSFTTLFVHVAVDASHVHCISIVLIRHVLDFNCVIIRGFGEKLILGYRS